VGAIDRCLVKIHGQGYCQGVVPLKKWLTCLDMPVEFEHCDECHESNDMAIVEFDDCKIVCCCEAVILINLGEQHAKGNRVSEREESGASLRATIPWREASKTVH